MVDIDRLPNKSVIKIQINTKFKPQIEDGEDYKIETIKSFHSAIFTKIEKFLTENEEFEGEILEMMDNNNKLPKGVKEFSDLGDISIQLWEKELKIKQKELMDDEIKIFLSKLDIKLDKSQRKLTEVKL